MNNDYRNAISGSIYSSSPWKRDYIYIKNSNHFSKRVYGSFKLSLLIQVCLIIISLSLLFIREYKYTIYGSNDMYVYYNELRTTIVYEEEYF